MQISRSPHSDCIGKEEPVHPISDLLSLNLVGLTHFNFATLLGFIGVLFHLPSYYMKTIIPLRVAAIIGNCFLVAYGYLYPSYMTFLLFLLISPDQPLPPASNAQTD